MPDYVAVDHPSANGMIGIGSCQSVWMCATCHILHFSKTEDPPPNPCKRCDNDDVSKDPPGDDCTGRDA